MSGTPRRGPGGFPATPQTNRSPGVRNSTASTPSRPNVGTLPNVPTAAPATTPHPLIPTDTLDFGQQRFYLTAFYVLLLGWRLWDFYMLTTGEGESLVLWGKWAFVDAVFVFFIPLLGIPRLEWTNTTCACIWLMHAVVDYMLMFQKGIPLQSLLVSALALFFDSESAIGERNVSPGPIIHNASLILGQAIINILPEGSAILNPDHAHFCLNSTVTQVDIPLQINQTEPIEIDLLRIDIETNSNETITLKKGELKSMLHKARRRLKQIDTADPLLVHYTVKKSGVYLLKRVLDKSKLEVRDPRDSSVVVATCPKAQVKPTGDHRCRNDLSNVELQVEGIPPLRIKYRTTVEGRPREASEFQSLQPDDFMTPLSRHNSQALVRTSGEDVSWARPQTVNVPLSETLAHGGTWLYEVEEVEDALGNVVSYTAYEDDDRPKASIKGIRQSFKVHERPTVVLQECTPQKPLRVAKGQGARLPIKFDSTGKGAIRDAQHTIEYVFTSEADLLPDGYHSDRAELKRQTLKTIRDQPHIAASGLYTVKSVKTEFCEGEVLEPASCLLQNPPEPQLSFTHENITDKCKGNPIGVRVALDLIGTPPFTVRYTIQRDREKPRRQEKQVPTLRGAIDLTPPEAGHYTYTFESIKDWVYPEQPLRGLSLEQDVKPSASAHFIEAPGIKQACIDDSVDFDVKLQGEGPWTLEYEVVHNGKRTKHEERVEEENFTIRTQKLKSGGEYTLTLTGITDTMNCKEYLKEEAKVNVRHEKPRAYFGHIEGKLAVRALEGRTVGLPLRLTGVAPWTLQYENLDSGETMTKHVRNANDKLDAKTEGIYRLQSVRDSVCPGDIEDNASQFSVGWIPRPKITVPTSDDSPSMIFQGGKYVKEAVCEGDEDTFDVLLSGNAPYDVSYEETFKDKKSMKVATRGRKDLRALSGSASIRADTSKAGTHEYTFVQLADAKYDHSSKHFSPVTIQQIVNPLPSARFANPGKTYSFCSREADGDGVEVIPVTLEGVPPFYLEVEVKHHGTPKPEISVHKNIPSNKYDLKIEHRKLHLGTSAISIRKIRDARGCTQKPPPGGPRVQISVHDAPSATALEDRADFCVGDRLSFALGGQVPFTVFYTFEKQQKKATNAGTTFRRLAELPGTFTITGLKDSASECLASMNITKQIHPIPSVRLSGGQVSSVDIHEGGSTNLEFQLWGTPPFEFTYTRSTNANRGKKSKVLEIMTERTNDHHMSIPAQDEGTYEVVSIKDRWCNYAKQVEGVEAKSGQKLLQY
ncbi:hypothetical protein BDV96DRAFT_608525 [Lophiotrema nucula]|uniref:Nucleoporin Pom152 n=1 Tax=Lophiotrema nucula TaxID=690887 RepID=A0A6A5ZSK9_9PLEO|nr:hypothetical protein BDV96DRAFT_608525 [Lophiotrema nucula]